MDHWGSLAVVALFAVIHVTVGSWPIFMGPRARIWRSVGAGTALAYVFAHLLPEIATVQDQLVAVHGDASIWVRRGAYLLALSGLLIFLAFEGQIDRRDTGVTAAPEPPFVALIFGYGLYTAQVGYLMATMPRPGLISYVLVAFILGLHLSGLDHGVYRRNQVAYQRVLRWVYVATTLAGWAIGMLTDALQTAVVLVSAFIGGGIIITAIRDELPREGESRSHAFFIAAVVASAAILAVTSWQEV